MASSIQFLIPAIFSRIPSQTKLKFQEIKIDYQIYHPEN